MNSIHVNFFKIPNKIYDIGLSSGEILVLGYLLSLSNNKVVHPSKRVIANKIKLSKRSVDAAITSLVKRGILEYNRGYSKGNERICNQYHVIIENIDPICMLKSEKHHKKEVENSIIFDKIVKESVENIWSKTKEN